MKKITLILVCMLATGLLFAQSPDAFKYQAVARDTLGNILTDSTFEVQMSIIEDSLSGTIEYQETQTVSTNQYGLFSLRIGTGMPTITGKVTDFSHVDWSTGNKWIRTEIRFGLGNFQFVGENQLLSVPYAAYAGWNQIGDTILSSSERAKIGIGLQNPEARLDVNGSIISRGFTLRHDGPDFILGANDNRPVGVNTSQRALVHAGQDVLYVNYVGDFEGGVVIGGPSLQVAGSACKPGGGDWSACSDLRLKSNISDYVLGLSQLMKVRPVNYQYNGKLDLPTEPHYIGIIAQELQEVAPEMVSNFQGSNGEKYLQVDPSAFTYMLINAVKELNEKVEALEAEIKLLEKS